MGLNAKTAKGNGGGNRVKQPNIEPGSYPARVVSVIDLGVQPQTAYKGEAKPPAQMIRVTYELTDVFMLDEKGNEVEDKPRWISEDFKLYNLKADLAVSTKRYKTIDPDNEKDGDWSQVLGNGVMVGIVNNESKGNVYDNVSGTSVMRKKDLDKLEALKNEPYFFDLTDPDPEVWKRIPQWLQEKIQANINYEGSKLQELVNGMPNQEGAKKHRNAGVAVGDNDDADRVADGDRDDAGDGVDDVNEDAPW